VFEAMHARLPARHAVKILNRDLMASSDAYERFRREATVMAALRHRNIVQVTDFNVTSDGRPFLVMELLEGRDLAARLANEGSLPLADVVSLVKQIAAGLGAAHDNGITHRDLKPENVFLVTERDGNGEETREIAKILDFGISKVKQSPVPLTHGDVIFGTPNYMSPEQAQGRRAEIDGRTDQFALAALAFEMLTGCDAFEGSDPLSVVYKVVHASPRTLSGLTSFDSAKLDLVLGKALSKDKRERWESIRDLSAAFEEAARHTTMELR